MKLFNILSFVIALLVASPSWAADDKNWVERNPSLSGAAAGALVCAPVFLISPVCAVAGAIVGHLAGSDDDNGKAKDKK
jgi:hypothetical protein